MSERPWVIELLRLFAGDACDELRWRVDGDWLVFYVDCSDTFYWGTADSENVTEADLPDLHRAVADTRGCSGGEDLWAALWCARRRRMRPMAAFYRQVLDGPPDSGQPGTLAVLFDAAGPARPRTLVAP